MAKQGMKRPERTHTKLQNEQPTVPEIQGKAKHGKTADNSIITETAATSQKVYHTKPNKHEKPISSAYKEIDTDIARDNLENDLPEAELNSL